MLGTKYTKYSLFDAVREGRLEEVRKLIDSFGLSYSPAWSGGYVLLRTAIEKNHTEIAKLLLTNGSKVKSKNRNPSNTLLHFAVINGNIEIVEMLLDRNSKIDAENKDGRTSLHNAIKYNKIKITELLLNLGANVNARDIHCSTPLHIAVEEGYLQIAEHLLKHGAYVNAVCTKGYTPLHLAAEKGSEKIIKLLLSSKAHVDANTKDKLTPLHLAAEKGHEKIIKLLLKHGANVDAQDEYGKTILYIAVEKGYLLLIEHILKYCPDVNNRSNRRSLTAAVLGYGKEYSKIVESLLQYGFTVNTEDVNNWQLLHAAVTKGYSKIVEDLLKYESDLNMLCNLRSKRGCTPLHPASRNKQEEIARLLIKYETDLNAENEIKNTPIFYAIENVDAEITKLLLANGANIKDSPELLNNAVEKGCREIVEILLQNNADINAGDKYGRTTALHFTALCKRFAFLYEDPEVTLMGEIAKLLLCKRAYVNAQNSSDITTLHEAARNGCLEIVKILLEFCADTGRTVLHFASEEGHEHVVIALLEYGVDIDSRDKCGSTALHLAAKEGHEHVVITLLQYGIDTDSRDKYGRTALHIASEEHEQVVKSLLEYGADINIMSKNNDIPLDSAIAGINSFYNQIDLYGSDDDYQGRNICALEEIAEILTQHIVKIKTANLYVSKENLQLISDDDEISDFQNDCEKEIECMKSDKISNTNVSFHDILTKSISQLAIFVRNETVVQVLKSDDYKTKFPIYASMINSHFRKGIRRKELLEQGNTFLYSLSNSFPELPHNCAEEIFSYLSDKDLRIVIDAFKPTNVSGPNTYINDVTSGMFNKPYTSC